MSKLQTKFLGKTFKNPVILASGTASMGFEISQLYPLETLGGIALKGITLNEKLGNPPPRVAETPGGMLNSVGLQNPGVEMFAASILPWLKTQKTNLIANISGNTPEEYAEIVSKIGENAVDFIELNISCPNVKQGGIAFGADPSAAASVVKSVKSATKTPILVKLSPNVTEISEIAVAVEAAGADAISMINTLKGMRIDINSRRPVLKNNIGGLSGPAIFPVALRMVNEVCRAVKIPIIGMGGISSANDALEMMMAGASLVQIGTVLFQDLYAPQKICQGLEEFCERENLENISEIVGSVQLW